MSRLIIPLEELTRSKKGVMQLKRKE